MDNLCWKSENSRIFKIFEKDLPFEFNNDI
jgi:hypothetical protein